MWLQALVSLRVKPNYIQRPLITLTGEETVFVMQSPRMEASSKIDLSSATILIDQEVLCQLSTLCMDALSLQVLWGK